MPWWSHRVPRDPVPISPANVAANLTLIDLKPGTTYYLSLKSHPSTEPTIAWAPGWRDPSEPVACTTTKVWQRSHVPGVAPCCRVPRSPTLGVPF